MQSHLRNRMIGSVLNPPRLMMYRRFSAHHSGRVVAATLALTMPYAADAQSNPAGAHQGASVTVRVYVSLSDSTTRFYPVSGHRLYFYRTARDSASAVTDSTGGLTISLVPGDYRLVSEKPITWHGYDYSWNVPITVRPGMPIIDLRAPDAVRPSAAPVAQSEASAPVARDNGTPRLAARDSAGNVVFWRDPKRARSLSWWWAGAGHIYAGHEAAGYAIAGLDAVVTMVGFTGFWISINCETYTCDGSENALMIGGVLGSLILSAWSANDAAAIVRRENAAYHLGALRVSPRPFLALGSHRERVGVALALR